MMTAVATYFPHVNLGIAIDTSDGLIVPNVPGAQDLTVAGIARAISDLATRNRSRKTGLHDLEGGTFTLTNTGSRGSLLDTPILNAPEVGILAVGKVERRPIAIVDHGKETVEILTCATCVSHTITAW